MNNQINGGPAFPGMTYISQDGKKNPEGMTLRQYAAIKLAVPDSGLPWLDEMIVRSNRERLAAAALQGLMGRAWGEVPTKELFNVWAKSSYAIADAMLKASEVKP